MTMRVGQLTIETTPEQIIDILRQEVQDATGQYLFRRTKSLGSNLQFSCPFHGNGMEKHPSCGMSRDVSYSGSKVIEAGTVHCFTCGYTAPLNQFIADLFNHPRGALFGGQWLKQHFLSDNVVVRKSVDLFADSKRALPKQAKKYIKESELQKYRWFHPYMYERHLTDDMIEIFDVGYDKLTNCLTFPVKDLTGKVVFIYRRSVYKKFHKYGENDDKTDHLYGVYELSKYRSEFDSDLQNTVYVVESIINCLTLWSMGYPAVSTMGVGGGNQYNLLKQLPQRRIVLALDPDKAGRDGQAKIRKHLQATKIISELYYPDYFYAEKLDINSNPYELDFDNIIL